MDGSWWEGMVLDGNGWYWMVWDGNGWWGMVRDDRPLKNDPRSSARR